MADTLFSGCPWPPPTACFHPLHIHNLLFLLSAAFDVNQNCQNIRGSLFCLSFFYIVFFSPLGDFISLTTSNSNWKTTKPILYYADGRDFKSCEPSSESSQLISWFIDDRLPEVFVNVRRLCRRLKRMDETIECVKFCQCLDWDEETKVFFLW